ncbi:MAG: carboxylating nicotinate-nucleotide diphosphorylase [Acidimicrobiia bacterium]|nr:carboxylating nicotinate-nucleotide diphosphorylase [Acidimicrobiia bacterium]
MDVSRFDDLILRAFDEDLASAGDLTSESIFGPDHRSSARLVARQDGVVAGLAIAERVFHLMDDAIEIESVAHDGDRVSAGSDLLRLAGHTRALLTAERTALNFLGRLSGIATLTTRLVDLVEGTGVLIADTRKTTPTLRALEKYAVRMGGGSNHRFGLYDAVMIKDNHIAAAGGIGRAVAMVRARVGHTVKIEVEVETLDELRELLVVGADIVLLDNMTASQLREAVAMVGEELVTEASGGITEDTIRSVAETGVDVISVGALTHSAPNFDVALDFDPR